jgi:serine/threonine-protein kinase
LSNIEPTAFGDKYVLVEHIATGGMAEIYRAQYAGIEGFAKELVIKTLREEFAARPDVVAMFLDEARVAATLTHNNVVHTYDLGELGGEYFIAMELLKGQELVDVMRRASAVEPGPNLEKKVPLELSIGIIMQACEGLHYVHSRTAEDGSPLGLVHRDINPTNIHVGYDGVCKILDFGIAATRASAVAKKGQVAGKLSYMAPEQLQGHPIDLRADIFPLGVVLYELCLARRLFRGQREEVMRRVLEGDIPAPTFVDPKFPPALEAILMKALEVNPADRYQNCDHMFRDLEAFLAEEKLSWTPRRLSAMMVELFGEGSPAAVDYDDQYADLKDGALDFAAFETMPEADDEVPEWARGLEQAPPEATQRKRATIGSLEALVTQGRFDESGPNPVAAGPAPTASAPARPPVAATPQAPARAPAKTPAKSTARASADAPAGDDDAPRAQDSHRSGLHKVVREESDSAVRRVRRPVTGSRAAVRPATGSRPAVRSSGSGRPKTPGTGRQAVVTTGPLAAVAPDAASGRTFGHSVVSEQATRGGTPWVWLIALLVLSGLVYVAYTLLTNK